MSGDIQNTTSNGAALDRPVQGSPRFLQSGFTLIELLVAIGVILVLGALIFSSSWVVLRNARGAKCASNLRQIGSALLLYAGENNGRLPGPLWTKQTAYYGKGYSASIGTFLAPYLGLPELTNTAQRADLLTCPAWLALMKSNDKGQLYEVPVFAAVEVISGARVTIFGLPSLDGKVSSEPQSCLAIKKPASSLALSEFDQAGAGPGSSYIGLPTIAPKPVHETYRNGLYFDGHVEKLAVSR